MSHVLPTLFATVLAVVAMAAIDGQFTAREAPYVRASFIAHYLSGYLNLWVVFNVYGHGDMFAFHREGMMLASWARADLFGVLPEIFKIILHFEPELTVKLVGSDTTATMKGLASLSCLMFADSLWAISIAWTMLSFFGKVALYMSFRDIFPRQRPQVAIAVLLVPSVVYWTAGMIKESIVVAGIGFAALGFSMLWKRRFLGVIPLVLGAGVVALVKPHVVMSAGIAGGAFLYWARAVSRGTVEIKPFSLLAGLAVASVGMLVAGQISPRLSVTNLLDEVSELQEQGARGGSSFQLSDEPTTGLGAQLAIAPYALLTALYRPVIFEARNPQMLVNALESTAFLLLTIQIFRRRGYRGMMPYLVRYPILSFCLVFALIMALGTGLATGNLGTLSRYRVPLIPFFAVYLAVLAQPLPALAAAVAKPARKVTAPPLRARANLPGPSARPS